MGVYTPAHIDATPSKNHQGDPCFCIHCHHLSDKKLAVGYGRKRVISAKKLQWLSTAHAAKKTCFQQWLTHKHAPPKTNISSKKSWLEEDEISSWNGPFSGDVRWMVADWKIWLHHCCHSSEDDICCHRWQKDLKKRWITRNQQKRNLQRWNAHHYLQIITANKYKPCFYC